MNKFVKQFEIKYHLDNIDEIAKEILNKYASFKVFNFTGTLGAGKTTLIKSLCKSLGVIDKVKSPSFSIINEYRLYQNEELAKLYHLDLYRLNTEEEAFMAGISECFEEEYLCFIEWGQRASSILPKTRVEFVINPTSTFERSLNINELK